MSATTNPITYSSRAVTAIQMLKKRSKEIQFNMMGCGLSKLWNPL